MKANTEALLIGACVYVVELDPRVWENRRFREANPRHVKGKSFYYIGATALTPEERFANHKAGYKANRYVRDHGIRLAPEHYSHLPRVDRGSAEAMEVELANQLRQTGHAVWQH